MKSFEAIPTSPIFYAKTLLEEVARKYNSGVNKIVGTPSYELHCHLVNKDGMWLMKSEQEEVLNAFREQLAQHQLPVTFEEVRNGMIDSIVIRLDKPVDDEVLS